MDKRYQVFISSTYTDLKNERRAVIQAVIDLNCIPAGMELFPASDEEQFAFIKRVIDDCDYYLLIIGGRYGSVAQDGKSYTEKEFEYAVSRGLHVIALLHEDPDAIAWGKSEQDPVLREKLRQFRNKVCTDRLVKKWKTLEELPGFVSQSLSSTIHRFPAIGWVRGNRTASEDILAEINELRKHNALLQGMLAELKPTRPVEDLAGLDEELVIPGQFWSDYQHDYRSWEIKTTWRNVFAIISPYLIENPSDETVQKVLTDALSAQKRMEAKHRHIDEQTFKTIGIQLKALGLVQLRYSQTITGGMALFWSATPAGEQLTMQRRTVRTKKAESGTAPTS